jgi:hypothetical protein
LNRISSFSVKRWGVLLGAAALTALAGCSAEPPQELRGRGRQPGQSSRTETKLTLTDASLRMSAAGKKLEGSCDMVMTTATDTEILAVEGRQVTKHQTTIVSQDHEAAMRVGGRTHRQNERGALVGEQILCERTNGRWRNTVLGKKATAKQLGALAFLMPMENDDELFPEGPVKAGSTWTVEGSQLRKFFGTPCTSLSGKATMTFERTTTVNGEPCARIQLALRLKGKILDGDNNQLSFDLDVKGPWYRSLKSGYDAWYVMSGTIRMGGTVVSSGQRVQMEINGPVKVEATTKLKG